MKTCGRCSGCPGNQVPNPNHPDECFCPGDLVLDTNNPDQCVCQGNKIPDQSNSSHCICPANQILDINNPFQCLCHNGQFPNMTRQCSKYIFYVTCIKNVSKLQGSSQSSDWFSLADTGFFNTLRTCAANLGVRGIWEVNVCSVISLITKTHFQPVNTFGRVVQTPILVRLMRETVTEMTSALET